MAVAKSGSGATKVNVTLTLKNRPFSETAELVSQEIGYVIKFEETLKNVAVSGRFRNEPVEYFFHRILKGKNIIIDINDNKKEILIKNFGSKPNKLLVTNVLNGKSSSSNFADPISGKSVKEINEIYSLQEKNRVRRLSNLNTIDPMTGKKLSEIKAIIVKQNENYRKRQADPDSIDPVTGKTIAQINQIIEIQEAKRNARLSNPKAVDPMTGKTRAELDAIFALQERKRKERLNNPNAIDPMTGKTMAEINSILQKQEENRTRRLSR